MRSLSSSAKKNFAEHDRWLPEHSTTSTAELVSRDWDSSIYLHFFVGVLPSIIRQDNSLVHRGSPCIISAVSVAQWTVGFNEEVPEGSYVKP